METIGSSFEQNNHPDALSTSLRNGPPQRVENILHNACDSVASLALQKDIRLKIKTKLSTKNIYSADPKTLKNQILVNIITNAIKFSPRHSDVTLSLESLSAQRFLITVRDQGIGIPDDVIKALNTSASLPSERGTAGETGQGHGLQIALSYTKMLAGKLHLTSRNACDFPGESGTEVNLELPFSTPCVDYPVL